jgi:HD-GYP domain-containing protein (c-di-GMP phosphodiesterase class II)
MTRSRPYGYGVSREIALQDTEAKSGTQFDPTMVETLRALLEHADFQRAGSNG